MSLLRKSAQEFLQNFARGCKNPRQPQYSKRSQVGLYCGKDIRSVQRSSWQRVGVVQFRVWSTYSIVIPKARIIQARLNFSRSHSVAMQSWYK